MSTREQTRLRKKIVLAEAKHHALFSPAKDVSKIGSVFSEKGSQPLEQLPHQQLLPKED
jgi:hypothetical protein